MKNAHEFPGLYDDLFDFTRAGYAMIDVSSPYHTDPSEINFVRELQYVSPDPTLYWMKGLMKSWHITARGPLDPKVRVRHCQQVIETINVPYVFGLGDIDVFPSPYPELDYDCIVVRMEDSNLEKINQQLAVLPGVQTYIPYKPHLTLGYFKGGHTIELVEALEDCLLDSVQFQRWDFGRMKL
jgi:hypothetical protein